MIAQHLLDAVQTTNVVLMKIVLGIALLPEAIVVKVIFKTTFYVLGRIKMNIAFISTVMINSKKFTTVFENLVHSKAT